MDTVRKRTFIVKSTCYDKYKCEELCINVHKSMDITSNV